MPEDTGKGTHRPSLVLLVVLILQPGEWVLGLVKELEKKDFWEKHRASSPCF